MLSLLWPILYDFKFEPTFALLIASYSSLVMNMMLQFILWLMLSIIVYRSQILHVMVDHLMTMLYVITAR
jgi:hypothetical protein